MNSFSLFLINLLTRAPFLADLAYGAPGRIAMGTNRWIRTKHANWFPVSNRTVNRIAYSATRTGLLVGVTNVCNARCIFCIYRIAAEYRDRPVGVMTLEIFKKAINEHVQNGGNSVDLTSTVGDPLLDPGLTEKIEYARQVSKLTRISLTTNAIALTKNRLYKKLIDAGCTDMAFSLPGLNATIYRDIYGVDRYSEAIDGITKFLEYNRSLGEPVHVNLRFRNSEKPSQIIHTPDFQKYIQPYLSARVFCNFTVDFDNWAGGITQHDMRGTMVLRTKPPQSNAPCEGLFSFIIHFDGSVRLCGCRFKSGEHDELMVGHIKDHSIAQLAISPRVREIINDFYRGERPSVCQNCTVYSPVSTRWLQSV